MRCKLGDISEITKLAGYEFTKYIKYTPDGEIIAVRALNLKNGALVLDDIQRISKGVSETLPRSQLHKNDIVLSYTGTLGECAQIREDGKYHLAPNVCKITPNDSVVNPNFLFQYIRCEKFKQTLINYAHGSTQPTIPMSTIRDIPVDIPDDLEKQGKIAAILSTLDEKIVINRAINNNLEQQAQAILTRFMETYAFELRPLSEIADVIDCLHSKKPDKVDDSVYQLIQLDNIRDDGFLDLAACRYMISKCDYDNWTRKCEIVEGDCVITNVGRIGAVSQAPFGTHAAMGRNMTCIRLKNECDLRYYFITVLLSQHMRMQIRSNTDEGTIMGALNVKNIPKLLFPIFNAQTMHELEETLSPIRKQIEYLNLMNQNLAAMRDALLPKLISGAIDVSAISI